MSFQPIIDQAHAAGIVASQALKPYPMQVIQGATIYHVTDGACGFAWDHMKGNIPFARFAKKAGLTRPNYYGGVDIHCKLNTQSVQIKEAYCEAYVEVLKSHGIDCYADSRLD